MSVKKHVKPASQRIRTLRQKLRGGVKAQSVPDDSYRAYLAETFGVTSTTQLTESQLRTAFHDFKLRWPLASSKRPAAPPDAAPASDARGHEPTWRGRYHGRGERGAAAVLTQPQADEIARLEDVLGWTPNPVRLQGFIRRQLGLPENVTKPVERLMVHEATKIITGLRRQSPDAAPAA